MSSSEESRIIKLKSSDDQIFEVEKKIAEMSLSVKHLIEDLAPSNDNDDGNGNSLTVPVQNVPGETLAKVIEYCRFHVGARDEADGDGDKAGGEEEKRKAWDDEFIKQFEIQELLGILNAASYLHIEGLQNIGCNQAAEIIKDKTVEEVREIFNIENDYTPEEEAELRHKHYWAFQTEKEH